VRGEGRGPRAELREREENEGRTRVESDRYSYACGKLFAIAKKFGFDDART
jgi:hypothetical protein